MASSKLTKRESPKSVSLMSGEEGEGLSCEFKVNLCESELGVRDVKAVVVMRMSDPYK